MRKLCEGLYLHRGEIIVKDQQGIYIPGFVNALDIYKSIEDARQAINKYNDGTNTKEPVVIGQWQNI